MTEISENNMKGIDLHIHTTASDGVNTPEEVVDKANQNHLVAIAITDHDTVAGVQKAIDFAKTLEIKIIPGIELTTNYEPLLHILGVMIQPDTIELKMLIHKLNKNRIRLLAKAFKKVNDFGIHVNIKEILRVKGTITIVNLQEYLLERKQMEEGCALNQKLCSIIYDWTKITPSPQECISIIHSCEGIAVLAHPGLIPLEEEKLRELLIRLKQWGLDGIEVIHPSHTNIMREKLQHWAKEFGFLCSGGSDYHGIQKRVHVASGNPIDSSFVPHFYLDIMKQKACK